MKPVFIALMIALPVSHGRARPEVDATSRKAAPSIIIVSGKPLVKRVVLTDWNENLRLMTSLGRLVLLPSEALKGRPSLNVAMYWGIHSKDSAPALRDTVSILDETHGGQRGTFYPQFRDREALWVFGPAAGRAGSIRAITPDAAKILRAHGIPTQLR